MEVVLGQGVIVTWHVYRGCWVLTGWVTPFWGLLASLSMLLRLIDTSHPAWTGRRGLGSHHMHFMLTPIITIIGCSVVPNNEVKY